MCWKKKGSYCHAMRYSGVATTYSNQHDGTFAVSYSQRKGNLTLNRN